MMRKGEKRGRKGEKKEKRKRERVIGGFGQTLFSADQRVQRDTKQRTVKRIKLVATL